MADTPDFAEQVRQSHVGLIHRVVMHCNHPGSVPDMEQVLQQAEVNEWNDLVAAIREIMAGKREDSLLLGLDDEDRIIVDTILRGLQDPGTLPELEADFNSEMAAPGIAGLVYAAKTGNMQALHIIGNMAKQMLAAGGDMSILAGRMRPLVEGERDAEKLAENMTGKGQKLMTEILEELLKLEAS